MKAIRTVLILVMCLGASNPGGAQTTCSNPTIPAQHATCLGIPDGPNHPTGTCPGADCDPLNWDGAKFTTIGLTSAENRIDYYFVAHNNRILHNTQTLNELTGLWSWAGPSTVVKTFSEDGGIHGTFTTVGLGSVLKQTGVKFVDPVTGRNWNQAMYMVYQFDPSLGSAGHVCVSFSDDGASWSSPIRVVDQADLASCLDNFGQVTHPGCDQTVQGNSSQPYLPNCRLQAEAFAGFLLPNPSGLTGVALFAGLEGDLLTLACSTNFNNGSPPTSPTTRTRLFEISTATPDRVTVKGDLPVAGMSAPTFSFGGNYHYLFTNLEMAYDPRREQVLITRLYPFPFDHQTASGGECSGVPPFWSENTLSFLGLNDPDGNAPCDPSLSATNFCPSNVGTHPMRAQIYSNVLRTADGASVDDAIDEMLGRAWTLEADWGRSTGWSTSVSGTCGPRYPTNKPYQRDIGIDLDSVGLLKTGEGWIPEGSTIQTFLGGFRDRNALCQNATYFFEPFLDAHQYTLPLAWDHLFKDGFESGTTDSWNGCRTVPLPNWCTNID